MPTLYRLTAALHPRCALIALLSVTEIAVNNSIITILHILGEMYVCPRLSACAMQPVLRVFVVFRYFNDLVQTFMEVFEPIHQHSDKKKKLEL